MPNAAWKRLRRLWPHRRSGSRRASVAGSRASFASAPVIVSAEAGLPLTASRMSGGRTIQPARSVRRGLSPSMSEVGGPALHADERSRPCQRANCLPSAHVVAGSSPAAPTILARRPTSSGHPPCYHNALSFAHHPHRGPLGRSSAGGAAAARRLTADSARIIVPRETSPARAGCAPSPRRARRRPRA